MFFRSLLAAAAICSASVCAMAQTSAAVLPFVSEIGWWSHQQGLRIESLHVTVQPPKLNLLNANFSVTLLIEGTMKANPGLRPSTIKLHRSERVISTSSSSDPLAEIIITPVVDVDSDRSYDGGAVPFSIEKELTLHTMAWGTNTFVISSGDLGERIEVFQGK